MNGTEQRSGERLALGPQVRLRLVYRDRTRFGSPVSERCEREMRKRFAVLYGYREQHGLAQLVRESPKVLRRVMGACLQDIRRAPDRLHEDWLYPDAGQVEPAMLRIERGLGEVAARIELSGAQVASLADWLGEWQWGAREPTRPAPRRLWRALYQAGALVPVAAAPPTPPAGANFVGHASVQLADGQTRILVDPFLLPRSDRYPPDWQPPGLDQLGRPDAVLITHSHPDHFDPGSLLRCGADTPIYVPGVVRESVLAIDMGARLRQLGFRKVFEVEPWQSWRVGDMRVHALPFHGEQPTVSGHLHPEVRNQGATYLVEVGGRGVALLADTGRDGAGDIRDCAARARLRIGAADTVFGCYRGFALYPVQYAFSSVSRYLPLVPESCWGVRQQIMCDAHDLIDVGETWGAQRVVPYAAGGAPWHWMLGLGPCLDGSMPEALSTDPPPQSVVRAAAERGLNRDDGALASPLRAVVLRVGDTLKLAG